MYDCLHSFVIPIASSIGCKDALFFFQGKSNSIASLEKYDTVYQAFVRHNTALPFNASVERVFSVAVDMFTKKAGKMFDKTFESQLLLKTLNKELVVTTINTRIR